MDISAIFPVLLSDIRDEEGSIVQVFVMVSEKNAKLPYIVYSKLNETDEAISLGSESRLYSASFQIDIYAVNFNQLKLIDGQIFDILHGFRGTITIHDTSIDIGYIIRESTKELTETEKNETIYRITADFLVSFYKE